jgi:hypothetical protein
MTSTRTNIGAYIATAVAGVSTNVTAGGSGNNALVNGTSIDLNAMGGPLSVAVVFPFAQNQVNGNTLTIAAVLQTTSNYSNASSWVNVGNTASILVATGTAAAAYGSAQLDVAIDSAQQFLRVAYLPTMSGAGTDTANVFPVVMIFGGQAELPPAGVSSAPLAAQAVVPATGPAPSPHFAPNPIVY